MFGYVLPFFSIDWDHKGIAKLFNILARKNYVLIYLTARNIGLAKMTRDYINSIEE